MELHTRASLRAIHGFDGTVRPAFGIRAWFLMTLKRIQDAQRRRRDYEILLEKTERELADIGLTRADVVAAARHGRKLTRRRLEG